MSDSDKGPKRASVILCPSQGCDECKESPISKSCTKVQLEEMGRTVIVVEPRKKMIHLRSAQSDSFDSRSTSSIIESIFLSDFDEIGKWDSLISAYFVGPYLSLFFKQNKYGYMQHYSFPRVKTALEYSLIAEMERRYLKSFKSKDTKRYCFQERLEMITKWIVSEISTSLPEMNYTTKHTIANYIAHQNSPIGSLFPLILDESVEEIYLDRPGEYVYFDHSDFGRVQSMHQICDDEVSKLSTLLRAESNLHLDRKNPSLKTDMLVYDFPLRFSTSVPPLSPDGMNLEIRKARLKPFTIFDLILNNTLSYRAAAFLILSINSRLNITITGGPSTGKTTLMNALDFTTPNVWRKIYIEDALESRVVKGSHQIRFRVDPLDESDHRLDKSTEILKCLHRSPDYMILGEIQTAEHSHALFQSIVAGLRSIQTCHSNSPSSLVTRWAIEHQISMSSLALMDIIVSLKRPNPASSERFVDMIAEVCRSDKSGLIEFRGLNIIYDSKYPDRLETPSKDGVFSSANFADLIDDIIMRLKSPSRGKSAHVELSELATSSNFIV